MSREFWRIACVFHVVVAVLSLGAGLLLTRWLRRRPPLHPGRIGPGLIALALVTATGGAAHVAAQHFRPPVFALTRFSAQALFGEGLLLVCWLSAAAARARRFHLAAGCTTLAILLLATYWAGYRLGPADLRVRRHRVQTDARPLPRPIRVLHLSDMQIWQVGELERHVLDEAAATRPDIVILTGDYVQERLTRTRVRALADFRQLLMSTPLRAPLGVYAIWGNLDADNRHVFDGLGVRCLDDQVARISLPGGGTLAVLGLSWETSAAPRAHRIETLMSRAGAVDRCIVAGHAPDFALTLAPSMKADLILAGHTHGGQVCLPWLGPLRPRRHGIPAWLDEGGLHELAGTAIHVSRGIGMERASAPQIRLFCPPEICLLLLS